MKTIPTKLVIITKIKNESVEVFEAFIDALSFVEMQKSYKGDLLVMNSIALLNTKLVKKQSRINVSLEKNLD